MCKQLFIANLMIINHFYQWLHHSCHIERQSRFVTTSGRTMPYPMRYADFLEPKFHKMKRCNTDDEVIVCTIESGISGAISCYIKWMGATLSGV
jgi:hypothetical protein